MFPSPSVIHVSTLWVTAKKKHTQYLAITSYKADAFILQNHLPGMASKNIPYLAEQKQSCL